MPMRVTTYVPRGIHRRRHLCLNQQLWQRRRFRRSLRICHVCAACCPLMSSDMHTFDSNIFFQRKKRENNFHKSTMQGIYWIHNDVITLIVLEKFLWLRLALYFRILSLLSSAL